MLSHRTVYHVCRRFCSMEGFFSGAIIMACLIFVAEGALYLCYSFLYPVKM